MEEQQNKLDEREPRANLGPKSVAFIVSTAIGALSRMCHPMVLAKAAGGALALVQALEQRGGAGQSVPEFDEGDLTSREVATILTGVAAGFCQLAPVSAVRTAVGWLAARDDVFWKMIEGRLAGLKQSTEPSGSIIGDGN